MRLAQISLRDEQTGRMLEVLDELRPQNGEEDLRGFEWYYLWRLYHAETRTFKLSITGGVAISLNGQWLAGASKDKRVTVWIAQTFVERFSPWGHYSSVTSVAFSPDSQSLASMGCDGMVLIWNARTGDPVLSFKGCGSPIPEQRGQHSALQSAPFGPDGLRLVTGGAWLCLCD